MTGFLTHPQKITFADFPAVVPENAVRGRGVEVEIRKGKTVEELLARERHGAWAHRKGDLACVGAVELRRLESLHIVACFCKPLLELTEGLLGIRYRRHFAVRQARAALGREIADQ